MFRKLLAYCVKRLKYRSIIRVLNTLKKRDITDVATNSEFQTHKLQRVLKTAFANIPYYSRFERSVQLDDLSYHDFLKIPLLTKDIIRTEGDNLINSKYPNIQDAYINTSGGSTGEPVQFYRTKAQSIHGMANYFFALSLNNVNIYAKSVDLWGAERDMYKASSKIDLRSFMQNNVKLNTFVLSDDLMRDYINRMNKLKPEFIKAYVHSVYELAKFINFNKLRITFTPTIHCTTGPLYPEMRDEIKRAFNGAHVYNFYGSREVSAIASEIKSGDGMHVLFDNVLVEILDERGRPVGEGEEGYVVVTTLNNMYMPLIRYKIGDRAVKGDELNFGTLKLQTVVGRTLGVIHKGDGTKIDGQFFTTMFFDKPGIKSFQLVQKTLHHLVLYIVKSDFYKEIELRNILDRLYKLLPAIEIEIIFVEKINLTSTGKIMYVYSEIEAG